MSRPRLSSDRVRADVVQAVNSPEFLEGPIDQVLHGSLVGEVEFDGDRTSSRRLDALDGGVGARDVDVADGDERLLVGEGERPRPCRCRWHPRRR